jgi:hypothetical protein
VPTGQLQPTCFYLVIRRFNRPDVDAAAIPAYPNGAGRRRLPDPALGASRDSAKRRSIRPHQQIPDTPGVVLDLPTPIRIPRKPPQRENGEISCGNHIDRTARTPDLGEVRVIPRPKVDPLHSSVKRQESGARNAVLEANEGGSVHIATVEPLYQMID